MLRLFVDFCYWFYDLYIVSNFPQMGDIQEAVDTGEDIKIRYYSSSFVYLVSITVQSSIRRALLPSSSWNIFDPYKIEEGG